MRDRYDYSSYYTLCVDWFFTPLVEIIPGSLCRIWFSYVSSDLNTIKKISANIITHRFLFLKSITHKVGSRLVATIVVGPSYMGDMCNLIWNYNPSGSQHRHDVEVATAPSF